MVRQAMTNAAREGCRHASLVTTRDYLSAEAFVRQRLQGVIADSDDPEILRVSFSPELSEAVQNGSRITAAIEIDCENASWLPPFLFAGVKIRTYSLMSRELTGWEPDEDPGTGEVTLGGSFGN